MNSIMFIIHVIGWLITGIAVSYFIYNKLKEYIYNKLILNLISFVLSITVILVVSLI